MRIWFESDGHPWLVLGMTPNKYGVIKCKNLLTNQHGWFLPCFIAKAGKLTAK